jgi:predicted PurR-regulated permease PerM
LISRSSSGLATSIRRILVAIIIITILVYFRRFVLHIFTPVLLSIMFAYVVNPFIMIMEKRIPRFFALLILYCTLVSGFAFLLIYIIPIFFSEIKGLTKIIPEYLSHGRSIFERFQKILESMGISDIFQKQISDCIYSIERWVIRFTNRVMAVSGMAISKIDWIVIIPVMSYYLLKDREYFAKQLLYFIPGKYRKKVKKIGAEIHIVLHQFLRGQLIISIVVGSLTSIGLMAVGIKYSLILGVIMGVFNVIPYFGPIIGAVPILIIAVLESKRNLLYALLIIVIVQQIESGFISPRIIGYSVGIHPIYVMLSVMAGGYLIGVFGMLIAVPFMLILKIILNALYKELIYRKT